jgi:hypothetical protein
MISKIRRCGIEGPLTRKKANRKRKLVITPDNNSGEPWLRHLITSAELRRDCMKSSVRIFASRSKPSPSFHQILLWQ